MISLLWSLNRPIQKFRLTNNFVDRSTEKAEIVDKRPLEGEAQELQRGLKMVEYDLISGKDYLSKDFFKVPN